MASRTFRRVPRWLTFAAFGAMLLALLAPGAIPAPPQSRLAHTQPRPQLAISPASARAGATITRTITGREWPANSTVMIDIRSGDALVAQRTVNTNGEGQFNGAISADAANTPGVALVVEARSDQAAGSVVALAVNAADPTPPPSPTDLAPTPSPADPTPTPSPADPTPTPSPADPSPTPSPPPPTPTPPPPTPTPPPPTPTPPPPPTPTPPAPPTPTPPAPPTPTPPAPPTPTPPAPAPTPLPPTPTPLPPSPTPAPPTPAPPSPTPRPPATQPPTIQPPATPRPSASPVCALSRDRALAGIYVLATCSRFPVGHSIRVVWPNGRTLTTVPFPADPQTFSFQVPGDAKTGAYIIRFVDASDSSIQAAASLAVTATPPGAPPTQPLIPAPPGAPKHNVVVFLGGVCTGLGSGASPVISSQVAEGQRLDLSDNQQATFHYLQQALRQRYGYSDGDFLAYSYNGGLVDGGGVWRHRAYLPTDPIQNDLDQSVENLHSLLYQYSRAHPNTRFILVGHSLGGLVAFQELNYVASADYAKGAIAISTIITVDSPLAGVTQDTFSASKALNLALPNKVGDCAAGAFYDMQDTATGQRLLDMNRSASDTTQTNEQLVAAARGRGVRVVNVGNTRDCLYAPGACTYPLPLAQGDIDTQWIPNSTAEARTVADSAGCITVFSTIATACATKTHIAALNGESDPGAVTDIASAIGPVNPPQSP